MTNSRLRAEAEEHLIQFDLLQVERGSWPDTMRKLLDEGEPKGEYHEGLEEGIRIGRAEAEAHDTHMKRARAYHRKWLEELADLVISERHRPEVQEGCGWDVPHVPTAPLLDFIARKEVELDD